jgi:hypothetical protein
MDTGSGREKAQNGKIEIPLRFNRKRRLQRGDFFSAAAFCEKGII